jgi:hypothetical protein
MLAYCEYEMYRKRVYQLRAVGVSVIVCRVWYGWYGESEKKRAGRVGTGWWAEAPAT